MYCAHSESAQLDRSNESVRAQAETTRRGRQDEVQNLKALCKLARRKLGLGILELSNERRSVTS